MKRQTGEDSYDTEMVSTKTKPLKICSGTSSYGKKTNLAGQLGWHGPADYSTRCGVGAPPASRLAVKLFQCAAHWGAYAQCLPFMLDRRGTLLHKLMELGPELAAQGAAHLLPQLPVVDQAVQLPRALLDVRPELDVRRNLVPSAVVEVPDLVLVLDVVGWQGGLAAVAAAAARLQLGLEVLLDQIKVLAELVERVEEHVLVARRPEFPGAPTFDILTTAATGGGAPQQFFIFVTIAAAAGCLAFFLYYFRRPSFAVSLRPVVAHRRQLFRQIAGQLRRLGGRGGGAGRLIVGGTAGPAATARFRRFNFHCRSNSITRKIGRLLKKHNVTYSTVAIIRNILKVGWKWRSCFCLYKLQLPSVRKLNILPRYVLKKLSAAFSKSFIRISDVMPTLKRIDLLDWPKSHVSFECHKS